MEGRARAVGLSPAADDPLIALWILHWKDAPIVVDLDQLWQQLGVRVGPREIELDANAPLVSTRRAMTSPPKQR
jgi:hypothetical protein